MFVFNNYFKRLGVFKGDEVVQTKDKDYSTTLVSNEKVIKKQKIGDNSISIKAPYELGEIQNIIASFLGDKCLFPEFLEQVEGKFSNLRYIENELAFFDSEFYDYI